MIERAIDFLDSGTRILAAAAVAAAVLFVILPAAWIIFVINPPADDFIVAREKAARRMEMSQRAGFNRWVAAERIHK